MLYRTTSADVVAVGYDVRGDSPVELAKGLPDNWSVLRRIKPGGEPGEVIWKIQREAYCVGACGIDVLFSKRADAYVVRVPLHHGTADLPMVFVVSARSGAPRLLARAVRQPTGNSAEGDEVQQGVTAFATLDSIDLEVMSGDVIVVGSRPSDRGRTVTYLLDPVVGAITSRLDAKVVGATAGALFVTGGTRQWVSVRSESVGERASAPATSEVVVLKDSVIRRVVEADRLGAAVRGQSGDPGELVVFSIDSAEDRNHPDVKAAGREAVLLDGCGTRPNRTYVTGVWATGRGTIVVAVEQDLITRRDGIPVYGGKAHCLCELE
jgi:hypothetical protein